MRIIVIGATGTIGKAVADLLSERHEVVRVGHTRGDYQVDTASEASIAQLYQALAPFDAVVSVAGNAVFKPLAELATSDFHVGLDSKFMGQVNLVRLGLKHINEGGSFTLTSGVLSQEPAPGTAAISPINAAVEGFCRAAALELPRGVRINTVSPPWVTETLVAYGMDPTPGQPAASVARAYAEAVEGSANGTVIDARRFA